MSNNSLPIRNVVQAVPTYTKNATIPELFLKFVDTYHHLIPGLISLPGHCINHQSILRIWPANMITQSWVIITALGIFISIIQVIF